MKRYEGFIGWCGLAALVAAGCGGQKNPLLVPNQPPEVELFAQRVDRSTTGPFEYRLQWVGHDPDGSVDHFLYAVGSLADDPRKAEWTSTTARERPLSFAARIPSPARASTEAAEPSVFTVLAVDGAGAKSAPARVAFFEGALAPQVQIVSPPANPLIRYSVPPTVCFEWRGTAFEDSTGARAARIVEYRYTLLTDQTEVTVQEARIHPDRVRQVYAPDFEGWTSTGGNVTSAVLRDLTPDQNYMFVITCFDRDGNYDPIFSQSKNMIYMRVAGPGAALPRITAFNEFFQYTPDIGSFDPSQVVNLEVPAGQRITFNWYATPSMDRQGNIVSGPIRGYRWAVDLADVEDPRHGDDAGHSGHWTPWGLANTSATVGPFQGGETHTLYIEANTDVCEGSDALVALVSLRLNAIQASFDKELLIVDDTRLAPDRVVAGTACNSPANRPTGNWPTAAELDTFLYARGGVPWKCYPSGTLSTPGIFNGYSFDTLGTRRGTLDLTVPLSTLARYRNVLWLVDRVGALNDQPGSAPTAPQTSMRYMNQVGKENTLAAYVQQGGRVWLAGGGAATASMINFNRTINDNTLPIPRTLTFRNSDNELIPGRFIYDQAHWRSEFKQFRVDGRLKRYLGRFESTPGIYAGLPVEIQVKTPATDPFPPNRAPTPTSVFYQTQFDIEFLSAANEIVEDLDPRSHHEDFQSTQDTLYKATAPILRPDTGPDALQSVVMTYYHGQDNAPFIVTGFNIWNFRRTQCVELVDFVLQQLWGMTRVTPGPVPVVEAATDTRIAGKRAQPREAPGGGSPGAARRD